MKYISDEHERLWINREFPHLSALLCGRKCVKRGNEALDRYDYKWAKRWHRAALLYLDVLQNESDQNGGKILMDGDPTEGLDLPEAKRYSTGELITIPQPAYMGGRVPG